MKFIASLILAIALTAPAFAGHGVVVRQQVVVQRQRVFVPRQRVVVQQFVAPQAFYAPQQFVQPIYSQQFNSGCNCQQLYR
tara:strand:+ start:188 stop:430 length:243 start_codon:yes stop_codon:yes gene_type:complete